MPPACGPIGRCYRPLLSVNCAAIPEDLIENELFGHEKGSYTGASEKRQGKFEMAHNGSLFLDEIGDMSLKTQAKVLRAIQEGEFQRVGGTKTLHSDVRIIAATNKDLEEMTQEGAFREDLYFRINVVPLIMPALRERVEDIPLLVEHFSREFCRVNGIRPISFGKDAMDLMKKKPWHGNIRELKNFIERHMILTSGDVIGAGDIEDDLAQSLRKASGEPDVSLIEDRQSLQDFKEAAEKKFLLSKLEEHNWNIKATAEAIGTPRSNLYKRMQYYGISRND